MFGRPPQRGPFGARHILWFPFLLIALTVILAVTIVVVDDGSNGNPSGRVAGDAATALSDQQDVGTQLGSAQEAEYKTQAARLLVSIWGADLAETSVEDLKSLRDQLVALRVPSSMRDVHIKLVAAVNQRIAGVEGDVEAAADADIRSTTLLAEYPWLR